ncbi:MAG TPA: porin family protein [Cytophagaceae bacterium]|jgi:hypothetical protein|nr:porin family protein [Cytophagaceae bacterium]
MKKLLLLSFFCALFINAQAQKPFTFGPMIGAGFNTSHFSGTGAEGYKSKANGNFLGGAFARISIKRVYIQPELYYSSKISNFTYPYSGSAKNQIKTGNVNINALVGVKLLKLSGLFNLRVFAGPSTSLIVANGYYYNGTKEGTANLKSSSFNVQAGLGVDISKLTIDFRYEQGLNNISNAYNTNLKINSVFVTLGFKIL